MRRLVLPRPTLVALEAALASAPRRGIDLDADLERLPAGAELRLPWPLASSQRDESARAPGSEASASRRALLRVYRLAPEMRGVTYLYWRSLPIAPAPGVRVELALAADGCVSAAWIEGAQALDVEELFVPGPRLERIRPGSIARPTDGGPTPAHGRFSRLIGALGGAAVHERLRALSVQCVGEAAGEVGLALARAGTRSVGFAGSGAARLAAAAARFGAAPCSGLLADLLVASEEAEAMRRLAARGQRVLLELDGNGARVHVALRLPPDGQVGCDCASGEAMHASGLRGPAARFAAGYAQFLLERLAAGAVTTSLDAWIDLAQSPVEVTVAQPSGACGACAGSRGAASAPSALTSLAGVRAAADVLQHSGASRGAATTTTRAVQGDLR